MAQFFEQKQAIAIRQMFDARLESIVIGSQALDLNDSVERHTYDTTDIYRKTSSKLSVEDPGIQLLLGRNGSGKSILLRFLETFGSGEKSIISGSLIFSLPSDVLLDRWNAEVDELVDQAKDSEVWEYPGHLYDELKWVAGLPILEKIRESCNYEKTSLIVDGERVDYGDIIGQLGLPETGFENDAYRARYDEGGAEWNCYGPPTSYSPRIHATKWILKALENGQSKIEINVDPDAKPWINPYQAVLSDEWFEDDDRAKLRLVGGAYEQFMESCTHFELNDRNQFRFLAPIPLDGPLAELLTAKRQALPTLVVDPQPGEVPYDQLEFYFPLDLFTDVGYDQDLLVGSNWFQLNGSPTNNHKPFIQIQVISLHGTTDDQFSSVFDNSVNSFLEVRVLREFAEDEEVSRDLLGDEETIVVNGFKQLEAHFSEIGSDLLSLDIGIEGLRLSRIPLGNLLRSTPQTVYVEHLESRQFFDVFRQMKLQWKQPHTGNWLNFEDASQGQRDVMLMLLAMSVPISGESNSSTARFLLLDEFDQHLHPTATAIFLEIAHRRAKVAGQRVILSTHSVPILAHPSTRQAPRIFARRTFDGAFSYSQRPPETREQLAAELGVDLLAASAFSRLFVMVEGEHDEAVLQSLLTTGRGGEEITGVELINARGTWAFEGNWNNVLRYHSAPVLVVHDKRDLRFEKAWAELKERAGLDGETMPRWSETDFHTMRVEIDDRSTKKKSRRGDDETDKMLKVVFSIFGGRDGRPSAKDVLRLTFHGIDSPDIIRLLPIDHFLDARRHGSWEAAEEWWGRQGKGNSWNEEFKKSLKLTTSAVRTALSKTQDGWHSELQRLYDVMTNLYHAGGPEERNG